MPSPVNGVTFCQANFKPMGEDLEALAREWCSQKKIFFVHFRDVEGTREETFHDNGPTDMARMLEIYNEGGFDGPLRPDHAPTLEGESNDRPWIWDGGQGFCLWLHEGNHGWAQHPVSMSVGGQRIEGASTAFEGVER